MKLIIFGFLIRIRDLLNSISSGFFQKIDMLNYLTKQPFELKLLALNPTN